MNGNGREWAGAQRAVPLLLAIGLCAQSGPSIRHENGAFRVEGAGVPDSQEASKFFSVYVAGDAPVPPLLGSYRREAGALIFTPRFPLQAGIRYRAEFQSAAGTVTATFEIPKQDVAATTVVEHVYPSANVLPENQLKLYVHFSAPMSRGEAYRRVHLLDENGKEVEQPFLEVEQELWDREGKRLTILFDPGRIKRGLVPHEEVGPPLREGKRYSFVIDREWRDAENRPLKAGHVKGFRVSASDRDPPEPKRWVLRLPKAGTGEPLGVLFPKPMDRALLEDLLEVTDARVNPLAGSIQVDREETRWSFTPRQPWQPGNYFLSVGTILEDLAGNTINHPFEVDVFERISERISREKIQIPFTVGAGTQPRP